MNSPYWFEVAVMFGLLTAGHIVFDRFATGVPKWLRFVKAVTGVGVGVLVSATLGRFWFFALLGVFGVALVAIHGWWLPRQGINGWTGEPLPARDAAARGRK